MNIKLSKVKGWSLLFIFNLVFSERVGAESIFTEQPSFDSTRIELQNKKGKFLCFNRFSSEQFEDGGFSWIGKSVDGVDFLTLSYVGEKMRGSVDSPQSKFQFRGDLINQEIFFPDSKIRPCGGCNPLEMPLRDPRSGAQSKHAWRNADAGQIDLMVVYPSDVRKEIGSEAGTLAEINNAVNGANLCFRNSHVPIQLRLVHAFESSYNPTGNLDLDLERLTKKDDGYLDNIHSARDQYGADIVTLLSTDSSLGGLANTLSYPDFSFEDSAFNVCVWDQIGSPAYTLAHEIGHNMGCLHNREDANVSSRGLNYYYGGIVSSPDLNYYYGGFAYGKRWVVNGEGYRTVMSYNDSAQTYNHSIPFFSNPAISYIGVATGNEGQENNALALSLSSSYVSNFRPSKIQGILPNVFSTSIHEGNYTTLKIRLTKEPDSEVEINLSLSNSENFKIGSSTKVTFNQNNWNLRQPVLLFSTKDQDSFDQSGILTLKGENLTSTEVNLTSIDTSSDSDIENVFLSGVAVNPYGVGLKEVEFSFSTGSNSFSSDANGSFLKLLEKGYSGMITPYKSGYSFSPSSLAVENISTNSTGHTFIGARKSVVYVNHQSTGLNDGTNWNNAYTDLSDALELADSFTEIWVAQGTYRPSSVRSGSFVLPGSVTVMGGFKGDESTSGERDTSLNPTILSGDIGVVDDSIDNSFHVVIPLEGSVLDGFIIEDGNATENFTDDRGVGAGLWAEGSDFTIRNCQFRNNWAFQGGGAIWTKDSNATFSNCTFLSNSSGSTGSGGAIWVSDSNLTLTSCTLTQNKAAFWGGAIRADTSTLSIDKSSLLENQSYVSNGGGSIYQNGGSFSIVSTSFSSNQSIHEGGAILIEDTNGTILDSNFTNNHNSEYNGGGALFIENSSPTISNCKFTGNKTDANNYGGAIKLVSSSAVIKESVFQFNQSTKNSGGAIFIDEYSAPVLSNNDFLYNNASSWGGAVYSRGSQLILNGGLFLGNWAGYGGGIATNGVPGIQFENIRIFGNEANMSNSAQGGFLYLGNGSTHSKFSNCVIANNKSSYRNGVLATSGEVSFINCTLFGNEAVESGAVSLLFSGDSLIFENSILWANSDTNNYEVYVNTGSASVEYSLLKPEKSPGIAQGTGIVSIDPLFADSNGADDIFGTEDDDFSLLAGSPAIGSASSAFSSYHTSDIRGRTRDSSPDIGAYEYFFNSKPVFSVSTNFSVFENNNIVADLNATDADGDNLSFSLIAGADRSLFTIDESSGSLSFIEGPNFEIPLDVDGNNIYEITIAVTDGYLSDQATFLLSVLDVEEAPYFVGDSSFSVLENNIIAADLNATDADGDELTFSLSGGTDLSKFSIDPKTGILRFISSPDYEYPEDSGFDNTYEVQVKISDGNLSTLQSLLIQVADTDERALSSDDVILLINGYSVGGGWMEASWFGQYHSIYYPWVYHSDLGWIYVIQSKSGESWMWKNSFGWFWTDIGVYPYFFLHSVQSWAYAGTGLNSGRYYSFENGNEDWINLN
jgi:predicted outer membrane repeat protein